MAQEQNLLLLNLRYFSRPIRILKGFEWRYLQSDMMAGLTVTIISLPQAIAYALVAGLPPEMGLYTAIIGPVVAALWGSSNQLQTSPTTALSLLVLSSLSAITTLDPSQILIAAGLLAVMVGVFQLIMGLARLGVLVNFVSDSVIVGFAAGAGVQIAIAEFRHLFGVNFTGSGLVRVASQLLIHLPETHVPTLAIGLGTLVLMVLTRKLNPKLPAPLVSLTAAAVTVFLFHLDKAGVKVIGQLPRGLPPLTVLPIFDFNLMADLLPGALAVAALGLIQALAVARSVAAQTGQRLDSNQEFVGQGLGNIVCGFFSGYPCCGSISCTVINHQIGAKSPLAAIFSGLFTLVGMLVLAPMVAYLPRSALSGILIVVGYGMIDRKEMVHLWRGARGDALIMAVTFLSTLFLPLQFAVLAGILMSLAYYIMKTSTPRVCAVLPNEDFKHFLYQPDKPTCPQLGIIQISGDLYFGAVNHIEETIHRHLLDYPEQRFLLFRMHSVNHCDFSGIHMLETVRNTCRERGGDIFFVRLQEPVSQLMKSTGFYDQLGDDHFLEEEQAITIIFHKILDPAICIYECPVRIFKECQNLPKRTDVLKTPISTGTPILVEVPGISPRELWQQLSAGGSNAPLVIDVREPREYKHGHIPAARLLPLPKLLSDPPEIPQDRTVVFVCRGGRRSRRATYWLLNEGHPNVKVLQGGMLAWESAGLLEAIDG